MYFIGIVLLLALLALSVFMFMKDGMVAMKNAAEPDPEPAPVKAEETSSDS
ncbi:MULTISPECIES: hypothetical protein [unclassified Dinoroseobacter]|uniref:hypothetical protein n=1 Tax=unclassified Dinoroseobacter TaxID=2620028 RepID=UPI003C7AE5A8